MFHWRVVKAVSVSVSVIFILLGNAFADCKAPNVAGSFYPADSKRLKSDLSDYVDSGSGNSPGSGQIIAGIAPHAGYVYSGPVAGCFYRAVEGKEYDRVVIIGPSHFEDLPGVKTMLVDCYKTPIGALDIDVDFSSAMIDGLNFADAGLASNTKEHCLEVHLPFVKFALGDVPVVLVLTGRMDLTQVREFGKWLYNYAANSLVIASTDMSHYYSYNKAVSMDKLAIDAVRRLGVKAFLQGIYSRRYEFCGYDAVAIVKDYAERRNAKFSLLKYANSGDTTGSKDRVVGYMAGIFSIYGNKEVDMYSAEQRKTLLKLARRSIEHYLKTGERINVEVSDPGLYKERGAFVTLKERGNLRGCIGHIIGDTPLCEVVANMAVEAAVGDPRFPAVKLDELPDIEIEISVLTPLKKLEDINDIKIGRDGLLLRRGHFSGLLLPQVPVEFGWNREEFLQHLAMKAGLNPDMWKGSELYRFSAEVFSEGEVFKANGEK